ncbi:hypothetical protein CR203_12505 [Salipaludibacillus neizhouensis]|uniref:Uncharacterized protein n=1 Tax=Salipaludibacillus neizhouensis TaxID=885475 RepID=A0A3A9KCH1_9BACI|nr:hypothetical protein [Salipaludibacillus neizhouensis]RKL67313.1 hypothetical protein CR203_12505 [Salipaludibacillus neizhouensis]
MKNQFIYGFLLLIFLALPPVANLLESIMIVHMHMQMPLLVIAGFLMAGLIQQRLPQFFKRWNHNGVPGILLFSIIMVYWMIPRLMDEALTVQSVELFKYISLPFLAGVPLRDSWQKIRPSFKNVIISCFSILFFAMGWLYITWPEQLCNNYLLIEQITLGWGFLTMAVCMVIYLIYNTLVDPSDYEEPSELSLEEA